MILVSRYYVILDYGFIMDKYQLYVSKICEYTFILCDTNSNDIKAKHIYK